MQIKQHKNTNQNNDKNSCLCWSPNGKRLAVYGPNRVIWLFDKAREKRD